MKKPLWPNLLLLSGLLLGASPSLAQDYAAAGRYFTAAQDAFAQGNFQKAAEQYQQAFDITKDPLLLVNIGESHQRAGNNDKALASYRKYLEEQPSATDRPEIEKRITALTEAGVGSQGQTPGQPEPDSRKGTGPKTSAAPEAGTKGPAPTLSEGSSVEEKRVARLGFAGWTTIAGGVALLTTGGILGLGAQNRADELTRRTSLVMNGQPGIYNEAERAAYESLVNEGRGYNIGAITTFAIGGAAVITGGVLLVLEWKAKKALAASGKREARALLWRF